MAAIRKFNKYCAELQTLAGLLSPIPVPKPLSTELNILRDDPYLMEDVWIDPSEGAPPRWLEDSSVRKGIKALLKIDRTKEEERHLKQEAGNICSWFGWELAAIHVALHTSASESRTKRYTAPHPINHPFPRRCIQHPTSPAPCATYAVETAVVYSVCWP